jgi:putative peptidoglycan lipid II flippase
LLARPLTALLFQYGEFDEAATSQTAEIIQAYSMGVWAYCGILIVHRAYYAVGDRVTPLRVGMIAIGVNLLLNFTLIWFLGGRGLALATAIAAIVQVSLVIRLLERRIGALNWRRLAVTAGKALFATAAMGIVCVIARNALFAGESPTERAVGVLVPLAVSIATYLAVSRVIGFAEPWQLLTRDVAAQDALDD